MLANIYSRKVNFVQYRMHLIKMNLLSYYGNNICISRSREKMIGTNAKNPLSFDIQVRITIYRYIIIDKTRACISKVQ